MRRHRQCQIRRQTSLQPLDMPTDDDTIYTELDHALQAEVAELEAFAHTVAHQIKSPLNVVAGYTSLLMMENETSTAEERAQFLNIIQDTVAQIAKLVDELLLLADAHTIELQPVDMAAVVANTLARLDDMITTHQAEIVMPEHWPVALGYAPWLEEIWLNYLTNALKYGGRPPKIELGATPQMNGQIRFWIQDNGLGLPQGDYERIFEPFVRLRTDEKSGHGLGLSIVRRIVRRMNGETYVNKLPGGGSVFGFLLPEA
ncbi:MAG: sensor histidine kinase [Chloroflexi bacterium]|nr:MAG: sensor histidine kinase [Chloroflexota bacterium]